MAKVTFNVSKGGNMRFIHSQRAMDTAKSIGGTDFTIRRASHVDPAYNLRPEAKAWLKANATPATDDNAWYADLLPVNGPVLGPFTNQQTALDTEVAWLKEHNIPVAGLPQGPQNDHEHSDA